jgi:hypothetical protein
VKLDYLSQLLARHRLPVTTEAELQGEIEKVLVSVGLAYEREVQLAPGDRVDFMVEDVGVEVKVGGRRRAILRQCERYAASDLVAELLLVSSVPLGFANAHLSGKRLLVHSLGMSWL